MDERLTRELRLARQIALVGTIALTFVELVYIILLGLHLAVFASLDPHEQVDCMWVGASCFALILSTMSSIMLAAFLYHVYHSSNPFDKHQSRRLFITSFLLLIRMTFDFILDSMGQISIESGLPGITLVPQSGLDLKVVVMVVFLVCLAMVVRYGDALKEDSDAFV